MSDIIFYDQHGIPIAYSEDAVDIYLYTGKCVAYIDSDSVYSYKGKHLGWYENGWIRDNHGYCVFFTIDSRGGPINPMPRMTPMKSMKKMKSMKGMKKMKPMKAMRSLSWSDQSGTIFFD